MELTIKIETPEQGLLAAEFLRKCFGSSSESTPLTPAQAVAEIAKVAPQILRDAPSKPTPLETAIVEKKAEEPKVTLEQPAADPYAALTGDAQPTEEPATEAKKPRGRPKKAEASAEEPKVEEKKTNLDDVRAASKIALELVGAAVIQEALAKFNAVNDKQALQMSALREPDFDLYIGYLKKKVNDAAKEWPANG